MFESFVRASSECEDVVYQGKSCPPAGCTKAEFNRSEGVSDCVDMLVFDIANYYRGCSVCVCALFLFTFLFFIICVSFANATAMLCIYNGVPTQPTKGIENREGK